MDKWMIDPKEEPAVIPIRYNISKIHVIIAVCIIYAIYYLFTPFRIEDSQSNHPIEHWSTVDNIMDKLRTWVQWMQTCRDRAIINMHISNGVFYTSSH
jgi:hypothetical protein